MNNEPTTPVMTETIKTPCDSRFFPSLCWKDEYFKNCVNPSITL
jgi:hypothetical protein